MSCVITVIAEWTFHSLMAMGPASSFPHRPIPNTLSVIPFHAIVFRFSLCDFFK